MDAAAGTAGKERVMLIITVQINAPVSHAIGIKESIAMDMEKYGDVRVVSVEEKLQPQMEQMTIGGSGHAERGVPWMRR